MRLKFITLPITAALFCLILTDCKEEEIIIPPEITSFSPESGSAPYNGAPGTVVIITGLNFSETPEKNTVTFNGKTAVVTASSKTEITTSVPVDATTGKIEITVGVNSIISATDFTVIPKNVWEPVADFGGAGRNNAVAFSIGGKGYVGTGLESGFKKDFWEYDPSTNSWTQKTDFLGNARNYAVGFAIGSKGYIGTGNSSYKDFYEYDPSTNQWTPKDDFAGGPRYSATSLVIGTKAYVGGGTDNTNYKNDWWEFDPSKAAGTQWTQKANVGGDGLNNSFNRGFAIGTKGYLVIGNTSISGNDFFEYDPAQNVWTRKAYFPDVNAAPMSSFTLNQSGYILFYNKLWKYTPTTNAWVRQADYPLTTNSPSPVGFSIGTLGYTGLIGFVANVKSTKFYKYYPD